jgi:hypothetical protein
MNKATVLGIVRHTLTFGGGFLVSQNTLNGSELEAGVGAVITLIGIIWSVIQKKRASNESVTTVSGPA